MNITRQDLLDLNLCTSAVNWLNQYPDASLQELWNTCPRSDWMLWVLKKFHPLSPRLFVQIACAVVRETPLADGRTVWDLLTDERSRQTIETAERWEKGEATKTELQEAEAWAAAAAAAAAVGAEAAA